MTRLLIALSSKKYYKIMKEGKIINSSIPGNYAGHLGLKIFGRLDCWSGKLMKKSNRVFFHTVEDAIQQGYRPCKNCRPLDNKNFVRIKHLVEYETLMAFYDRDKKKRKKKQNSKK